MSTETFFENILSTYHLGCQARPKVGLGATAWWPLGLVGPFVIGTKSAAKSSTARPKRHKLNFSGKWFRPWRKKKCKKLNRCRSFISSSFQFKRRNLFSFEMERGFRSWGRRRRRRRSQAHLCPSFWHRSKTSVHRIVSRMTPEFLAEHHFTNGLSRAQCCKRFFVGNSDSRKFDRYLAGFQRCIILLVWL